MKGIAETTCTKVTCISIVVEIWFPRDGMANEKTPVTSMVCKKGPQLEEFLHNAEGQGNRFLRPVHKGGNSASNKALNTLSEGWWEVSVR